jgi:hypothetical protein
MDGEQLPDQFGEGQPAQDPTNETGKTLAPAGSQVGMLPGISQVQSILPEATQQVLQELIDLPGQILPAETVYHLKNAGRESLLALYSLWQNINRASKGASGEKVRKHIEVE